MYDDADNLGKVMGFGSVSASLNATTVSLISQILVQFAGQLALGKVTGPMLNVLDLSADSTVLSVDLNPTLWSSTNGNSNIYAKKDLINMHLTESGTTTYVDPSTGQIMTVEGSVDSKSAREGMTKLWGDSTGSVITKMDFSTHDFTPSYTIANHTGVEMFVGSGGVDNIIGSGTDDIILGKGGVDYLQGGGGRDLIMGDGVLDGGAGDDYLISGMGDDNLTGGTGNDTFVFKAGSGADTITIPDDGDRIQYDSAIVSGTATIVNKDMYKNLFKVFLIFDILSPGATWR